MHSAVSTLPLAIHWLVPELTELQWPDEVRTTCSNCVMVNEDKMFNPKTRCCTYQPFLANFLAGRILDDPNMAPLLLAEIRRGAKVSPLGVVPVRHDDYHHRTNLAFGVDESLHCPYFVEGELTCGIWPHRNSVCRTWHCKFVNGERGWSLWEGMRKAIDRAEGLLAAHCINVGDPPEGTRPEVEWVAWYRHCAATIDALTAKEAKALTVYKLEHDRAELRARHVALDDEMPDLLAPTVRFFENVGDLVRLIGFSPYDNMVVPRSIFQLLSRLDGDATWPEALAAAREEAPELDEATVRTLWRLGILSPPLESDRVGPGEFRIVMRDDQGHEWRHSADMATMPQLVGEPEP